MRIHRLFVPLVAALGLIALAAGCSKKDSAPAVATVSFSSSRPKVPLGSPVDFTYRFDVAPNVTIPGNYHVFVHVNNPDGQTLWNDDHDPDVPTSQWKAGQTITYTRTTFVPVVPYVGEATVEIGLYKDNDRLSLQGSDPKDRDNMSRSYKVGTIELQPRSESLALVFKSGWHPMEYAPDNASTSWQWSEKSGLVNVRNPHSDAMLYLQYDARPDLFKDQPQQVTVYAGAQKIATFAATSNTPALQRIPVTAAQLGPSDTTDLRLEVDKTFVPASVAGGGNDTRELGIRVYHLSLEGR